MTTQVSSQIKQQAKGRWPDILAELGIEISRNRKHGPCPVCGGKDRFRFDDKDGSGTFFCNQCVPKSGDGLALIMSVLGCGFKEALKLVGDIIQVDPSNNNEASKKIKILRAFEWTDAKGRRAWHLRTNDPNHKFIWNQKADGSGKGTLKPCTPDLYLRDQVIAAYNAIVAAGERDADTINRWLKELGLYPKTIATTPYSGEASVNAEMLTLLYGKKQISVIGDNDTTGETYRKNICELLGEKVNALYSVWAPKEFNDVTEWAEAGGTAQDFEELLKEAKPHECSNLFECGLPLTDLSDLLNETDEQVQYLVKDLLPMGGVSVIGGKPKAGKTTTVRNLCLSVAKGEDFLGLPTAQGPVIYCAFEEKRSEVKRHFMDLGADGSLLISAFIGRSPDDLIEKIRVSVINRKPVLIVLDTLAKATTKVRDFNDYAAVTQALDPFLQIARETGAHLLFVHHAGKSDREGGDALLGSTAIFGTVDTALIQKRTDKYRTIEAQCRYGTDIEASVLEWDADRRSITLGGSKKEADVDRSKNAIKTFLGAQETPVSREVIEDGVEGRTGYLRKALKELVESEGVARIGKGGKGDPFMYASGKTEILSTLENYSCSVVPHIYTEQGNKNGENNETPHNQRANSCSRINGPTDTPPHSPEQAYSGKITTAQEEEIPIDV